MTTERERFEKLLDAALLMGPDDYSAERAAVLAAFDAHRRAALEEAASLCAYKASHLEEPSAAALRRVERLIRNAIDAPSSPQPAASEAPQCSHPSWKYLNGGREQCEVCGAVGRELRYLSVDGAPPPAPKVAASEAPQASADRCTLGVGCDEAGVCYARAHEAPEQCGRAPTSNDAAPDAEVAKRFGFSWGDLDKPFRVDGHLSTIQEVKRLVAADRKASAAPQASADGWRMVPAEATEAMTAAAAATPGMRAIDESSQTMQARGYPLDAQAFVEGSPLQQAWRAMLAAAPISLASTNAALDRFIASGEEIEKQWPDVPGAYGTNAAPDAEVALPAESYRDFLGRLVRMEWMARAREQPSPKASWLTSWEELTEPEREVDRRIGERIDSIARISFAADRKASAEPVDEHADQLQRIADYLWTMVNWQGGGPDEAPEPASKADYDLSQCAGEIQAIGLHLRRAPLDKLRLYTGHAPETDDQRAALEADKHINARVADTLRPLLRPNQRVIWREAFRWKDDNVVRSNHYECQELAQLAEDHGFKVIEDYCHAAIIEERDAAQSAAGEPS